MNQTQQIAADFVANHKRNNLDDWLPTINRLCHNKHEKLDAIFSNIMASVYGELKRPFNDSLFEVEISQHESFSGQSIRFDFEFEVTK